MIAIFRMFPLKVWIGLGVIALILGLYGAYRFQEARANRAESEARTATVTVDALDGVATKSDAIRTDAMEKQREVETIPGSEARLPDGYGADLQRLRDRERRNP